MSKPLTLAFVGSNPASPATPSVRISTVLTLCTNIKMLLKHREHAGVKIKHVY